MSRQLALLPPSFLQGVRAQEAVSESHEAIFRLVEAMQAKTAAIVLDVDEGTLSKKKHRKDRNRLGWDEAVKLLVTADREEAKRVIDVLLRYIGCKPPEDAPIADPEEYIRRLEVALDDELAPAAKERVLRKARAR